RLAGGLCRRVHLVRPSTARLRPTLRAKTLGFYRPDGGDCGAVLMGGRAVLEHCQPEAANGDFSAADCLLNPGRTALYLPDAPELAAVIHGLRDRAAGGGGGDGGKSEAGKTEGHSGFGDVSIAQRRC